MRATLFSNVLNFLPSPMRRARSRIAIQARVAMGSAAGAPCATGLSAHDPEAQLPGLRGVARGVVDGDRELVAAPSGPLSGRAQRALLRRARLRLRARGLSPAP